MRYFCLILLSVLFFSGCTSDEPSLSGGATAEDNVYLEFNKWVYKEMNHQYLWRADLPDSLDCNYNLAPKEFFNSLLSSKDRFSYLTSNSNYNPQLGQNNLGFAYQPMSDNDGNTALEILYITSHELKSYGFRRGDLVRITHQSNVEFCINKVHLKDNRLENDSVVYLVSKSNPFKSSTVLLDTVYIDNNKRIGYLCYLEYGDKSDLEEPLKRFKNEQITDLILDLRYNPGGYVSTCRFLCNCIVSDNAYGKIFQQCSYNDVLAAEYLKETGDSRTYSFFELPGETFGETLGVMLTPLKLKSLYVITSNHTASASEATIVCLRSYMPVTVIGEQTVGKGVGSWTISAPKFRYAIQPITMRYYNADGISTPDEGIAPDIYLPDGYFTGKLEIGDVDEKLLSVALGCITGNTLHEMARLRAINTETLLTPIGEPSYVTEFNNKHYNESN